MTAPRWIAEAVAAASDGLSMGDSPGVEELASALIERLPLEAIASKIPRALNDIDEGMHGLVVSDVVRVLAAGDPEVVELTELYQGACRALDEAGVPYEVATSDSEGNDCNKMLDLAGRILWLAQQRPTRLDLEPIRRRLVEVLQADPARSVGDDETIAGAADLIAGDAIQLRSNLHRVEAERDALRDKVDEIYASERALTAERDRARDHLVAIDLVLKAAGIPLETRRYEGDLQTAVQALRDERDHLQKMYEGASDDLDRERSSHQEASGAATNREIALTVDLEAARQETQSRRVAVTERDSRIAELENAIRDLAEGDLPSGDLRSALWDLLGGRVIAATDRQVLRTKVADQAAYIEQLEVEIGALEEEIWEDAP